MGSGGGETVLPMVELVRGSLGLSIASRPLCLPPPVPPDTPGAPGAPADIEPPSAPPELKAPQRSWPGLDHLGAIQAGGGLTIGLIALFSSYDHITAFGRSIGLQQQWGVFFIVASVATVFIDAQLATRARDRAGLGRKAVLIDAAQQGSAFGVQLPQPGVLAPQLLGFALDLLHPPFAPHLALLVAGIASPVEHRQPLSPPRQR